MIENEHKRGLFFVCFCLVFFCLKGMDVQAAEEFSAHRSQKKIMILTSVFPLMEFASEVGGAEADVSLLVPPGAEVHSWRPRPGDIVKLSRADVFIYIGPVLEPWVADILESVDNAGLTVINASEEYSLVHHDEKDGHSHEEKNGHPSLDPHIWLDFGLDMKLVEHFSEIFGMLRPGKREYFRENARSYIGKLKNLDQSYRNELSRCRKKTFVLGGHAAFGYLARRYGLEQIALYGLSPDAEPTPRQMIDIVEMARKKDIRVIYFEVNVSHRMSQVLADEIGAVTKVLNPGISPSLEEIRGGITFLDIMEKNLENLKYGLECQ